MKCFYCQGLGHVLEGQQKEPCPICNGRPLDTGYLMPLLPIHGAWLLARLYELNAGQHVLVAKSHDQLVKMVKAWAQRNPHGEMLECVSAEIVTPAYVVQIAYAEHIRRNLEHAFWDWVSENCWKLRAAKMDLPEPLKLCENYQIEDDAPFNNPDYDREHHHCRNCEKGLLLKGWDSYAWYLARRSAFVRYAASALNHHPVPQNRVRTVAPEADSTEPIWYVNNIFGGRVHSRFKQLNPWHEDEVQAVCADPPLLWFRLHGIRATHRYNEIFKEAKAEQGRRREQARIQLQQKAAQQKQEQLEQFLKIVTVQQQWLVALYLTR